LVKQGIEPSIHIEVFIWIGHQQDNVWAEGSSIAIHGASTDTFGFGFIRGGENDTAWCDV
jgi:hypothetical protein